jgi:hypothetical protein
LASKTFFSCPNNDYRNENTPSPFGGVTVDSTLYMGVFGDECDKYSVVSGISETPDNTSPGKFGYSQSFPDDEANPYPLAANLKITQVKKNFLG